MDPDFRGDSDHHDGTSDATPGGYGDQRRPGELAFAVFLALASLFLLYSAYGISGFQALSAPGSVPMATTLVMVVSALIIALRTARLPKVMTETLAKDILPVMVVVFIGFLILFGLALKPLGFVPTAALFLIVAIKLLARRGWGYTLCVALGSLVVIWIVFRVVFTVLLPAGIVPEAEFIQLFRTLLSGGAS
ncbi:tripartite tricarboxylate transporter TctB family protein [Tropicibacter oceani]|uniref:Tripartite tricarboxylate transporter TctB family protein n=1 Tax=Tropicibacter oceani TaxID=3058420 RepID=A0ABY8QN22_9RHOB|nr:tripartite tricarboxylate transporter TctB family protein [Tropicibacter oceani]WGW05979.1 tripartite tricarboxylate transporter TctB family protein [Tropicibacter oceani]